MKSVSLPKLLGAIQSVFKAVGPAKLRIAIETWPLSAVAEAWAASGKPRMVVTIP